MQEAVLGFYMVWIYPILKLLKLDVVTKQLMNDGHYPACHYHSFLTKTVPRKALGEPSMESHILCQKSLLTKKD